MSTPELRYERLLKIGQGGMATVYLGRMCRGDFSRLVAMKYAHPHLLVEPASRAMFKREARLASLVRHANVVSVQDIEDRDGELMLVMDYVDGASLRMLSELSDGPLSFNVALRIIIDACAGLHAVHTAVRQDGTPAALVHRDVTPHNILVGVDGVARLTDFGIAKGIGGGHTVSGATESGVVKGKIAYMAPEYLRDNVFDTRSDVFALAVVAWELLTGRRLFAADNDAQTMQRVLDHEAAPPSGADAAVDAAISKALDKDPDARFASAELFAEALILAAQPAEHGAVGSLVQSLVGDRLAARRQQLSDMQDATQTRSIAEPRSHAPTETTKVDGPVSDRPVSDGPPVEKRRTLVWAALAAGAIAAVGLYVGWRGAANETAPSPDSGVRDSHAAIATSAISLPPVTTPDMTTADTAAADTGAAAQQTSATARTQPTQRVAGDLGTPISNGGAKVGGAKAARPASAAASAPRAAPKATAPAATTQWTFPFDKGGSP